MPTTTDDGSAADARDGTVVRVLGVARAELLVDALAEVWVDAHPEIVGEGGEERGRGLEGFGRQIRGHFRHDGFTLAAAYSADVLVGFGYAFPCTAEYWYGEALLPKIPADAREGLVGLCELAVRPGWQSLGIGSRLHQCLVEALSPRWISLVMDPDNPRGRALYERLGYRYAGAYRDEVGGQVYDLLIAEVG